MQRFSSSHWIGVLLVSALLAGLAWAETLEMVTYYPAPAAATMSFDRLHANRITVGKDYSPANVPDVPDGQLLVFDRLGIGTIAPVGPLHVVGRDNGLSSVVFVPGAGAADIRVGIGTPTPGAELDVYHPQDAAYARVWGTGNGDNFSGLDLTSDEATDRIWRLAHKQGGGVGGPNDFHIGYFDGTNWSVPLAILANGNVGVGTTAPTQPLQVAGTAAMDAAVLIPRADPPAAPVEGMLYLDSDDGKIRLYSGGDWRQLLQFATEELGVRTLGDDDTIPYSSSLVLVSDGKIEGTLNITEPTPQRGLYSVTWHGQFTFDAATSNQLIARVDYIIGGVAYMIDRDAFKGDGSGTPKPHDFSGSTLLYLGKGINYKIRIWARKTENGGTAKAKTDMTIRAELILPL